VNASTNQPANFHLGTFFFEKWKQSSSETILSTFTGGETFPLLLEWETVYGHGSTNSLLLCLQGVFEARHLLETVSTLSSPLTGYVSPNQILEIKGLFLNSQCTFPFLNA